jgi:hypothetical protein
MKPLEFHRRELLKALGSIVLSSLVPLNSFGAPGNTDVTLDLQFLPPDLGKVLLRMLRLLFPHDAIDDSHYIAVVQAFDQMASAKPELLKLLNTGAQELVAAQPQVWLDLPRCKQLEMLTRIESTPFFETVRLTGRFLFYSSEKVWPYFGYEGGSFKQGGYLYRGFNDLDWLPEPEG